MTLPGQDFRRRAGQDRSSWGTWYRGGLLPRSRCSPRSPRSGLPSRAISSRRLPSSGLPPRPEDHWPTEGVCPRRLEASSAAVHCRSGEAVQVWVISAGDSSRPLLPVNVSSRGLPPLFPSESLRPTWSPATWLASRPAILAFACESWFCSCWTYSLRLGTSILRARNSMVSSSFFTFFICDWMISMLLFVNALFSCSAFQESASIWSLSTVMTCSEATCSSAARRS